MRRLLAMLVDHLQGVLVARVSIVLFALVASTTGCNSPRATSAPSEDAAAPSLSSVQPAETLEQRAARVHKEAIIIDGHNDITMLMLAHDIDLADPEAKNKVVALQTDLPRMKAGGITGEFFSIYVEHTLAEKPTSLGGGPARRALDMIDRVYQQAERHPESLLMATRAEDVRKAKREGKVACLMGIEGGHAIENSLSTLREFHRLGVRYMTLTHTNTNDWADSAGINAAAATRHHGLSPFGEKVVREMQRIGMFVDISHVSDETAEHVLKIAKAPVIASHSSTRSIAPHRRNLSDDLLKALAKNGGVAMINFYSGFLDTKFGEAEEAYAERHKKELAELRERAKTDPVGAREARARLRASDPLPSVPFSVLIDHIEHVIAVAGIDHVGLGSDFDGVGAMPEGMEGIDSLPKITLELLRRGHSDEDVLKVLGGNFMRAFEAIEAYAKSTNTTLSGNGDTTLIESTMPDAGTGPMN
ncbi:dipeptidase [Pendulispora rubella]|uniref:Dipeptidase n=1 Tax=Pendulispora rubella TaxID=2741070 RepID=A0ABZ2L9Q8_9BACT